MTTIEHKILAALIHNEEYTRKVLPFLKPEYFSDLAEREVFSTVDEFIKKYNKLPTVDAIQIVLSEKAGLREDVFESIPGILKEIKARPEETVEWLSDATENFCRDRAIYNAILKSISIVDGKEKKLSKDAIPSILQDALAVCFNSSVGHDYENDAEARYDYMTREESKIPFDIDKLNEITKGGLKRKTLNVAMAGTGVGKSIFMCHVAAACVKQGLNVLYISMEMGKEEIGERIDANLMRMNMDDIWLQEKSRYLSKINSIFDKFHGRLVIEQFPTGGANVNHFRRLLSELELKKKFKPDIIMIDYLNIVASSRFAAGSDKSHVTVKAVTEEIRGLAIECDVPILSATQPNRTGYGDSEMDITHISDAFGIAYTVDLLFAMIETDELFDLGQIMFKQLKNRYRSAKKPEKFIVGIDKAKSMLYNVEESADLPAARQSAPEPARPQRDFSAIKY